MRDKARARGDGAVGDPEVEVMVQQGHRRPHPDMSLAVVGKNCQEKNGVGMEVQGLQIVMVKNRKEELGKGGTRPAVMVLTKSG